MRQAIACGLALTICLCASSLGRCDYQIHVAPHGASSPDGSLTSPFSTIEQARDHLRQLREAKGPFQEPVVVWVHGGIYSLSDTLILTQEDSGTAEAPIHYRSYQDEQPVLSGQATKTKLDRESQSSMLSRIPEVARSHVQFFRLNIDDLEQAAALHPRALHTHMQPAPIELFQGLPLFHEPDGRMANGNRLNHCRKQVSGGSHMSWMPERDKQRLGTRILEL